MRLYSAICGWLEAHAASMAAEPVPNEPHAEGNNFAQAEHAHSFSAPPELHAGSDRQSLDDDQGGAYRMRPVGFQRKG
ncbi:MAG: hypothetical protein M3536_07310 [Actinomycetota bacterium]|nr:hypothetical protein [Actinomycetota bacterium]